MNGNDVTNHLNAAIVACELTKIKLLPMAEGRHPVKVSDITRQVWLTTLWEASQRLRGAQMEIEGAQDAIGQPEVTR